VLPCPSCDASIEVKHAYQSLGETVVYDNGVDCWNGCQVFHNGFKQLSADYLDGGTIINANDEGTGSVAWRVGLETAAWYGLTVVMPTFINYDREHMAAVAGFAKAIPPH